MMLIIVVFLIFYFLVMTGKWKNFVWSGRQIESHTVVNTKATSYGQQLHLHLIESKIGAYHVGLEVKSTSLGQFHIVPLKITIDQTKKLISILNRFVKLAEKQTKNR